MGATGKVREVCIYKCVLNRVEKTVDYIGIFFVVGGKNPVCVVLFVCLIVGKIKTNEAVGSCGEKKMQILIQGVENSYVIWQQC